MKNEATYQCACGYSTNNPIAWEFHRAKCKKRVNWNSIIVPITVAAFITVSLLASPTKAQDLPQVPPTPTVGEPARIERVYLPLIVTIDETVTGCENCNPGGGNVHAPSVNWNSKKDDGDWQARGNQSNE